MIYGSEKRRGRQVDASLDCICANGGLEFRANNKDRNLEGDLINSFQEQTTVTSAWSLKQNTTFSMWEEYPFFHIKACDYIINFSPYSKSNASWDELKWEKKKGKIYKNILGYFEIIFDEIDLKSSKTYPLLHLLYMVDIDGPPITGKNGSVQMYIVKVNSRLQSIIVKFKKQTGLYCSYTQSPSFIIVSFH